MGLKSPHFEKYSQYVGFSIGMDIISTPPKNDLRPFGKRSVLRAYLVSPLLTPTMRRYRRAPGDRVSTGCSGIILDGGLRKEMVLPITVFCHFSIFANNYILPQYPHTPDVTWRRTRKPGFPKNQKNFPVSASRWLSTGQNRPGHHYGCNRQDGAPQKDPGPLQREPLRGPGSRRAHRTHTGQTITRCSAFFPIWILKRSTATTIVRLRRSMQSEWHPH